MDNAPPFLRFTYPFATCEGLTSHVNLAPIAKKLGQAPNANQLNGPDWASTEGKMWELSSFSEAAMQALRSGRYSAAIPSQPR
ncbi:hypothetical protein [Pseudomonas fluorescens]|uniref:hypothetical protein n=1 Tax=Pseudomonas fluorescens TaxID=294 RepID=UPI00099A124B|nr:hypothetical protein [Pseudomonas fluorescens]